MPSSSDERLDSGPSPLRVRFGRSENPDAAAAVGKLVEQIDQPSPAAVFFFSGNHLNREALATAMDKAFSCPVFGCTTGGEILSPFGYCDESLIGMSLSSAQIKLTPLFIPSLSTFSADSGAAWADIEVAHPAQSFALLLIDGMSLMEDAVVATIHQRLKGVALAGGSAGDGLRFQSSWVYHEGAFYQNAAKLALCETTLPFVTFKIQHFEPTSQCLVITGSDPGSRRVMEINGSPAAQEYARASGLEPEDLSPLVFASHPLMLKNGSDYFVRSIQKVNDDGSLTFYSALDKGAVLTVAKGGNLLGHLETGLAELKTRIPNLKLVFANDCILRRLEMISRGDLVRARHILKPYPVFGFSTYGEQFNGVHVNHTLTGLALGE